MDIKDMFSSIKTSFSEEGSNNSFLKIKAGNTYLIRLLPNVNDPQNSLFNYTHHGWKSKRTGGYVDALCPKTWGATSCPICTESFRMYNKYKEDKAKCREVGVIRQHSKHMLNVYVINDPTNEANNGTVKTLRFGVTLWKKFDEAINGDDADEFGYRVFDLGKGGCTFKIKADTKKDGVVQFVDYGNSRFMAPSSIEGMTKARIAEIHEECLDLTKLVSNSSEDEMKKLVRDHFFNGKMPSDTSIIFEGDVSSNKGDDDEDDLDVEFDDEEVTSTKKTKVVVEDDDDDDDEEEEVVVKPKKKKKKVVVEEDDDDEEEEVVVKPKKKKKKKVVVEEDDDDDDDVDIDNLLGDLEDFE